MSHFVALLRGINVGGQKKVPMAELRSVMEASGLLDLQTYIQSGNLVFKSNETPESLEQIIETGINERFGFEVPTQVISHQRLQTAIARNPYADRDVSKLHLTFLASTPTESLVTSLPKSSNPNERFYLEGQLVYLYCPDGYGRTRLNNGFFETKLKVPATTRNWKTCLKLMDMLKDI